MELLRPATLDEYKLAYFWDYLKSVGQKILIIAQHLTELCKDNNAEVEEDEEIDDNDIRSQTVFECLYSATYEGDVVINTFIRKILQDIWESLRGRENVFEELTKRVDRPERQIVQRVDIIQEDHGKAILIFTIVSKIFLPLSFVAGYLGMNTADIRNMELNQPLFWQVAAPFTVMVVFAVLTVAYNANLILGRLSRGPTSHNTLFLQIEGMIIALAFDLHGYLPKQSELSNDISTALRRVVVGLS